MPRTIPFDDLTTEERIDLMGQLWDSLSPADAAPVSPPLAEELDRREAEADATPDGGESWADLRDHLENRLK